MSKIADKTKKLFLTELQLFVLGTTFYWDSVYTLVKSWQRHYWCSLIYTVPTIFTARQHSLLC